MTIKLSECLDDAELFWDWMEQEDACYDGSFWADGMTLREAWAKLPDPCWMMWIVNRSDADLRQECTDLTLVWAREAIDAAPGSPSARGLMHVVEAIDAKMKTNGTVPSWARADDIRARISVEMLLGGAK